WRGNVGGTGKRPPAAPPAWTHAGAGCVRGLAILSVVSQTGLQHDGLRASSLLMVDGLRPKLRATARWLQPSARITMCVARSSAVKCSQLVPIAIPCQKGVALGY